MARPHIITAGALVGAILLRFALEPVLGSTQIWLTFWPAVIVAVWLGGARAGVLTTIGAAAVVALWLAPRRVESMDAAIAGTLVFLAVGFGFAWVARSAENARELDRQLREQAAHEHAMLAELFEEAPWTMALFEGPELRTVVANARARELARRSTAYLGKPLFEAVPDFAGLPAFELLRHVFATGEPLLNSQQTARIHGHEITHLVSYQPVRNPDGTIVGVVAMGIDVTEQVATMKELEAARTRAQQADRAKDEFLAMLGHELRNPLAPMTTAVTLLRMRGHHSRELDVIDRQLAHMTRLVEDLLDVSRIVRGKIELRRTPTDLVTVLDKAIEMVSPMCEQTGHVIQVAVPPGLIVDADAQRLTQVFSNLMSNAIKFSEHAKRVDVRSETVDGRVRIHVIDEGVGLAPDMIGRVFEPFVQTAQTAERAKGGLGLGLAIVRQLVELHDGRVSVSSAGLGRGSDFTVELPLVADRSRAAHPAEGSHGQRILVVDDNPDVASMLAELLQTMGHTVRVASDGPEALEVTRTFSPTLALLDIGLPVMDGYELARQMRERGVDAPLVAISGSVQERDRERSRQAGFAEHLSKPVSAERLVHVIEQLAPPSTN